MQLPASLKLENIKCGLGGCSYKKERPERGGKTI